MTFARKKLVTIVVPDAVEPELIEALSRVSRGMSVSTIRGRGDHGERPNVWHTPNVRIETIVDSADVERVLAVLEPLRPVTPVIAWIADVDAWPPEKFGV